MMPAIRKRQTARSSSAPYARNSLTSTSEQPNTINIARHGDVILVVGDNKQRLCVSSHLMREASDVFDALFSSNFREGQNVGVNDPKEIPLPEDHPAATQILCHIIHLRNDSIPEILEANLCFEVGKLVDKYGLQQTVSFVADRWFATSRSVAEGNTYKGEARELMLFLQAADLMDHHEGFDNISKVLIQYCEYEYHDLVEDTSDGDWRSLCKLPPHGCWESWKSTNASRLARVNQK